MFQLNKKKITIIIIAWIILLVITLLLAILFNSTKTKNNFPKENNIVADYNGIDYYSFYDEND